MEHGYHPTKQGNTELTEGQQSKQDNPSGHKLVTEERYAELKKRMLELLNEQKNK